MVRVSSAAVVPFSVRCTKISPAQKPPRLNNLPCHVSRGWAFWRLVGASKRGSACVITVCKCVQNVSPLVCTSPSGLA